ncbi:9043_t:CDS:2 [Paraglomus occultum]|uniref:Kinetochore protein Spc24 n=1 Tax=Paraglomus occultum TaxID=144539 RepID=A0A9N9AHQ4_9GLOM|nr:9043_t:CDS:2 [Paraglomus occultum]
MIDLDNKNPVLKKSINKLDNDITAHQERLQLLQDELERLMWKTQFNLETVTLLATLSTAGSYILGRFKWQLHASTCPQSTKDVRAVTLDPGHSQHFLANYLWELMD